MFFFSFPERRPLKPTTTQMPMPLFRSPSARLVQRDLLLDDNYRGSDGSIIGSLGINKEVHYTFQPSKQIVSKNNLCTNKNKQSENDAWDGGLGKVAVKKAPSAAAALSKHTHIDKI